MTAHVAPAAVLVLLSILGILGGCRPSNQGAPSGAASTSEVVVPNSSRPPAPPSASAPAPTAGAPGWMVDGDELQPKNAPRAEVLAAIKRSPQRVVLVFRDAVEECSGLGGTHAFFDVVEPSSASKLVVHFGGHGASLSSVFAPRSLWAASITRLAKPESVKNEPFCVPDRTIDARATALVPVATREEGARLLAADP